MKRAKVILVVVPLLLLGGSVVVAKKRADRQRVILVNTQFRRALDNGDAKSMIHWLHLGANPNVDGKYGLSALDYAVGGFDDTGDLDEELLRAHADVNRRNAHGEPPLTAAIVVCGGCGCTTNDEEAIFLLDHGAHANVSYKGRTLLLDSADMVGYAPQNLRIIPVLLRHGADANKRNPRGKTAYDLVNEDSLQDAKQEKQRQHVLALLLAAMKHPKTARVG